MVYAMDRDWWRKYWQDVAAKCVGVRVSANTRMDDMGVVALCRDKWPTYGNSGAAAISIALMAGAKRIVLLGFDCKYGEGGKKHWHGDHPRGLGNAALVHQWREKFNQLAQAIPDGVQVLNCSRDTALDCFERANLEDVLK